MALRAKKPEAVEKRLKLFMFGPAGVGKTTAAVQFPNSYIIDCERGTENYDALINQSNSVVFRTTDASDVIAEIKALPARAGAAVDAAGDGGPGDVVAHGRAARG